MESSVSSPKASPNIKRIKSQKINDLLKNLNKEQREAINYNSSPLLILAGVGTGKTQTLMSKYAHLISKGVQPQKILAVTFTNKAAREMEKRAESITQSALRFNWIGTFHSLSARMLGFDQVYESVELKVDYHILNQDKQRKQIRKILKDQKGTKDLFLAFEQKMFSLNQKHQYRGFKPSVPYAKMVSCIDKFKNRLLFHDDDEPKGLNEFERLVFLNVYTEYQESLISENLVDYGDLILYMVRIFRQKPEILQKYREQFEYILVDEVQDLNLLQQEWLKLIIGDNKQFTCVGDDDQMIYGFRGAGGDFILNFEQHFQNAHIIRLEQNYRSTKVILTHANNLISKNKKRKGKNLWTENNEGEPAYINEFQDVQTEIDQICRQIKVLIQKQNVPPNQIAILTRTNQEGREFEKQLVMDNTPYDLSSNKKQFLKIKEVELALYYITVLEKQYDDFAWKHILDKIPGFGKDTCKKIDECAKENKTSMFDILNNLAQNEQNQSTPTIKKASGKRKPAMPISALEKWANPKLIVSKDDSTEGSISSPKKEPQDNVRKILKVDIKLNKKQKENLSRLMKQREIFKNTQTKMLVKYLTNIGFYEHLAKNSNIKEKDPVKCQKNVQSLLEIAEAFDDIKQFVDHIALFSQEGSGSEESESKSIKLMTIHSSKGLEFDHVFLPFWVQGKMPVEFQRDRQAADIEEERRCAFVGITRARKSIHISHHQMSDNNYQTIQHRQSVFLKEI
ncbi:rep helicase [Stylonychia lemnae]|uniref:DNA 3'-5' helicase n=1 Tax=Stylonychia lemnae TaxID=5949 RepID=A0A078A9V6_STYLE|nr:rep helicase [Stylonychia lemnae]|eukprot:CDW78964.1 rep helicase [Stylonychia lemnae]